MEQSVISIIVIALLIVAIGILTRVNIDLKKELNCEEKKFNNITNAYRSNNVKLSKICRELERQIEVLKASKAW